MFLLDVYTSISSCHFILVGFFWLKEGPMEEALKQYDLRNIKIKFAVFDVSFKDFAYYLLFFTPSLSTYLIVLDGCVSVFVFLHKALGFIPRFTTFTEQC